MASLTVDTPDGKTLTVDVPQGTDPKQYGALADDALAHYTSTQNAPSEGTVGSFLRGIGNNLPLGNQFASLVSKGPYSENMAAINNAVAQDKAAHPISYGAGAVTGTLAPAAVPGVGPMMAANPLTAGALLGGTNAINNTDIQKNPLEATAQAGTGAATGALISGLISKIMPKPATLEAKANTLANKSINMPSGILVDMTPEEQQAQGAFLRSEGLVGKDKGAILDKANDLMSGYGQKIGSIGQDLTKKGLTVDDPGMLTQPLVDKAQAFAELEDPEANSMYRTYMAGAKAIASKGETPSWSDLQGLKQTYGDLAFKPSGEIKNKAAADVYFTLSNSLKDIAQKAQSNPDLPNEYKDALAGYSRMSPIVSGLEKTVDADLRGASGSAGVGFHPMRMLASMPGPVRAIGGTIGALTGHPLLAVAAALPELMNPAVQSNVAAGTAKLLPLIQNVVTQGSVRGATNPINSIGQNPQARQVLSDVLARILQNKKNQQQP